MFGKKADKGPTIEQCVASLEFKMKVVEMILETSESEIAEKFKMLHYDIDNSNTNYDDSIKDLQEKVDILSSESSTLKVELEKVTYALMNTIQEKVNEKYRNR